MTPCDPFAALLSLFNVQTGAVPATYSDMVCAHEMIAQTFGALYAEREVDDEVEIERLYRMVETGEGIETPAAMPMLRALAHSPQGALSILWAARWRSLGFPCVELHDPKLAASLVCTDAGPDADEMFETPWPAFILRLPVGVLPATGVTGAEESVESVRVLRMAPGGEERWSILAGSTTAQWWTRGITRSGMLNDDGLPADSDHDERFSLPLEPEDKRIMQIARRLVRNVVLWIADPTRRAEAHRVPSRKAQRARAHARGGRSTTLSRYVLTAPVRIDVRQVVRSYLKGERSSPHVRGLVRGHWRNQAHGPGRTLRRLKWIDPHWRGGEALPIAVRSHVVGDGS